MKKLLSSALVAMMMLFGGFAQATHIDELGINISLFSSDGLGNFTLRYDEYFGTDSTSGVGPAPAPWDNTTTVSGLNISETVQGASITGDTGSITMDWISLTDSAGNLLASTQADNGNGTTDAVLYSAFLTFNIASFDSTLSYLVDVAATDCCYVNTSGGPSFDGLFAFDPSIVVLPPSGVPEASSIALLGLGLFGLGFTRRKNKSA